MPHAQIPASRSGQRLALRQNGCSDLKKATLFSKKLWTLRRLLSFPISAFVAGCKTRKDSVRFVDTLITASPDFFKGKKREQIKAFFQTATDFLSRKIGKGNIFTAVVHMDEKTPHMHLCFTPITNDGRLSAKDIIGNRVQLTKWQDAFFAHMVKSFPDIERGDSASVTGQRHIPTRVFKKAVRLTKQVAQIQKALDGINPRLIPGRSGMKP